jgi:hypothetical protein
LPLPLAGTATGREGLKTGAEADILDALGGGVGEAFEARRLGGVLPRDGMVGCLFEMLKVGPCKILIDMVLKLRKFWKSRIAL